jgi:hypothetical protein
MVGMATKMLRLKNDLTQLTIEKGDIPLTMMTLRLRRKMVSERKDFGKIKMAHINGIILKS